MLAVAVFTFMSRSAADSAAVRNGDILTPIKSCGDLSLPSLVVSDVGPVPSNVVLETGGGRARSRDAEHHDQDPAVTARGRDLPTRPRRNSAPSTTRAAHVVVGRSATDNSGRVPNCNARGKVITRVSTSGNQTVYDAEGRNVSRVTTSR